MQLKQTHLQNFFQTYKSLETVSLIPRITGREGPAAGGCGPAPHHARLLQGDPPALEGRSHGRTSRCAYTPWTISVWWILDKNPGSDFLTSRIHIKEFKHFNPKNCFLSPRKYDPGCSSRVRILIFYPSQIPNPKKHRIPDPDPQHWTIFVKFLQ